MLVEMQATTPDSTRAWRRFVKLFAGTLLAALVAIYFLILIVDPYDSGRVTNYPVFGVVDENPRTADVSRGRDPRFNSVVIGNSRGQLLDPKRLSDGMGLSFVQLTVPGTGPREQLALLRWFAHNHRQIGAVVLVADSAWCTQDPTLPLQNPFPFWLYGESSFEYLINVLHTQSLDRVWRRILLWLGLRERSRPDGYWDYEIGRTWSYQPDIPIGFLPAGTKSKTPKLSFPAVKQLETALATLDSDIPFAIVMPPAFFTALPKNGDANVDLIAQCKGALSEITSRRSRGAFLDFEIDGEIARDPNNFMDSIHYRAPLARSIEGRVVSALSTRPFGN
jgi:hypothetical protein